VAKKSEYSDKVESYFKANPQATVSDCVKAIGCCNSTVRNLVKSLGIVLIPKVTMQQRVLIFFKENKVATVSQCTEALGITRNSVYHYVGEAGLTLALVGATSVTGHRKFRGKGKARSKPAVSAPTAQPLGFDRKPLWRGCAQRKPIPSVAQMRKNRALRAKVVCLPEDTW